MDNIKTEYVGPKDGKGSRIRAWCARGSVSIPYPYSLQPTERHEMVANKLREKLAAKDAKKRDAFVDALARAARSVINNWSTGDLAAAVNLLEEALDEYNNAKGKAK